MTFATSHGCAPRPKASRCPAAVCEPALPGGTKAECLVLSARPAEAPCRRELAREVGVEPAPDFTAEGGQVTVLVHDRVPPAVLPAARGIGPGSSIDSGCHENRGRTGR